MNAVLPVNVHLSGHPLAFEHFDLYIIERYLMMIDPMHILLPPILSSCYTVQNVYRM